MTKHLTIRLSLLFYLTHKATGRTLVCRVRIVRP